MLNYFNKLKNQKGFTLVELMVVVVIIAILVAIIIPIYNKVQDNAAKKAHDANLRTIDGAISMYVAEHGEYPTDIDALVNEDYLTEEPKIPNRITDEMLVQGLPEGDKEGKYYLDKSALHKGAIKAFPVLKEAEAYRGGDTIGETTGD